MDHLAKEVGRAAKAVAVEWPDIADAEDVEQDIWVNLLRTSDRIAKLEAMGPTERASSLRRIGNQLMSQQRADYDVFAGNFRYGTKEVRNMLDGTLERFRDGKTETETIDLSEGMAALADKNERYFRLVSDYTSGIAPESKRDVEALRRGVRKLTEYMNSAHKRRYVAHDGAGNRKAISNRAAQASSSYEWQGDLLEGRR